MRKVLFIDTAHEVLRDELQQIGFECESFLGNSYEECKAIISDYYGIVIRSKVKLDKEMLLQARSLKFIARVGAGMESIDVAFAESRGVKCFNSPEGSRDAVAEHALGLLLMLNNHLNRADKQVKQGIWLREPNRGTEISGKTIGIIGYGNMGSAFAQRLSGFNCRILAYDKYKTGFSNQYVEETSMDVIYKETDILSIHLPLTDETRYLVDTPFINRFAKNFVLINTARGPIVNTECLVEAIECGKITAVALDVIEYEETSFEVMNTNDSPKPMQFLMQSDKVVLSPHIAGWTIESKYKLAKVLAEKIKEWYLVS